MHEMFTLKENIKNSDYVFIWIFGSGLMTPTTKCLFVAFHVNELLYMLMNLKLSLCGGGWFVITVATDFVDVLCAARHLA
ncbi:hypothetical protein T09_2164 [Trichinella sp. T9]|nr:hypothetical protein T09_2164 [Trichinella sp. T9]